MKFLMMFAAAAMSASLVLPTVSQGQESRDQVTVAAHEDARHSRA